MVSQFGMSMVLGPQSVDHLGGSAEQRFLQSPQLLTERGYSEHTQQLIDREVGDLLRRAVDPAAGPPAPKRAPLRSPAAAPRGKGAGVGEGGTARRPRGAAPTSPRSAGHATRATR